MKSGKILLCDDCCLFPRASYLLLTAALVQEKQDAAPVLLLLRVGMAAASQSPYPVQSGQGAAQTCPRADGVGQEQAGWRAAAWLWVSVAAEELSRSGSSSSWL